MANSKGSKIKPKDQALRNSEYYDTQSVKDDLYNRAKNNEVFDNLMELILSEENIKEAYRNIKKNKGSQTPGTDGKTIKDIQALTTEEVIDNVRKFVSGKQGYRPKPVRRKMIPKQNGGSRPLGIPCIWDRLIQQCIKQILEPICEAKFNKHSYGFRQTRSVEHAMADVYRNMNMSHLHYVVEFDIKGFFDNVNHSKLIKQIWSLGIHDKQLIYIIRKILEAPIRTGNNQLTKPNKGTPQGGILSPLLANIVLNELDQWIDSQWESNPQLERYTKRVQSNGNITYNGYVNLRNCTHLKEMRIVRYADDFRIFCRTKEQARRVMYATTDWLQTRLKLEISAEKTRIVDTKATAMSFLGFKIKMIRKSKKWVISSNIEPKQVKKIERILKGLIKEMKRAKDSKDARNIAARYNATVLGEHNHYKIASNCNKDFMKIEFEVKKTLHTQLKSDKKKGGRLAKTGNLSKFEQKTFGKSKMLRFDKMSGSPIYPIGYVKKKDPMMLPFGVTPYTEEGRKKIHENLGFNTKLMIEMMRVPTNQSIEYADNRISLYAAQWGKCGVTGYEFKTTKEIHCHHKTPKGKGGTDAYDNLILVLDVIHILIHATETETINNRLKEVELNNKSLDKLNTLRRKVGNKPITLNK